MDWADRGLGGYATHWKESAIIIKEASFRDKASLVEIEGDGVEQLRE